MLPVPIPGLYQAVLTDRLERAAVGLRLTPEEQRTLLDALFPSRHADRPPDSPPALAVRLPA